MGYYAAFLDVTQRPCLVVGGGEPALTKVLGLLEAGARVTVAWDGFVQRLQDLERRGKIVLIRRRFTEAALDGCFLAIDASGDDATGIAVSRAAQSSGIPVNVLDRPALCTFIAPALVRRGPLQVAISTSGRSPFLASHLRRRIERGIGDEWGPMVELTGRLRDNLRRLGVPLRKQAESYMRALASGALDHLRDGRVEAAETAIETSTEPGLGRVALVGAGPGDASLLTLRAAELLGRAQIVFFDALTEPSVLAWCHEGAELVPVGKRGGRKSITQEEIHRRMIEAAHTGRFVVRLKGGDPFVFGRGGEEVLALAAAGITVEVVPGVSSATAAPGLAGIPLTQRGIASSFAVTTARRSDGTIHDFRDLAGVDTLVVMMPVGSLQVVTHQLIKAGRAARCPAALVEAASTPRQRTIQGTLSTIARQTLEERVTGPAILVVGEVVAALLAATHPNRSVASAFPSSLPGVR